MIRALKRIQDREALRRGQFVKTTKPSRMFGLPEPSRPTISVTGLIGARAPRKLLKASSRNSVRSAATMRLLYEGLVAPTMIRQQQNPSRKLNHPRYRGATSRKGSGGEISERENRCPVQSIFEAIPHTSRVQNDTGNEFR